MQKIEEVFPESYANRLADASRKNNLSMVIVVSHEAMDNLKQHKPALLTMFDDVIVLVPQTLVDEIYNVAE